MVVINALLLITLMGGGQAKTPAPPAAPSVPFKDILACVQAFNCKNMAKSSLWWFDMAGIPVMSFQDDGWTYGLRAESLGTSTILKIYFTPPGSRSPTQLLALTDKGELFSGELGPQATDAPQTGATREQRATALDTWGQRHKVYRTGTGNNEFKDFWQKHADVALAAVARALIR